MTDKERLEKIKVKYNAGKLGEFIDSKLVNPHDLKYLIERVQELEKDIEEWKIVNDSWEEINTSLAKQNQRYKQALEFYGDKKNYEISGEKTYIGNGDFTEETWIEVDRDRGKKAQKALKGESE
jgi:hypothetical protein